VNKKSFKSLRHRVAYIRLNRVLLVAVFWAVWHGTGTKTIVSCSHAKSRVVPPSRYASSIARPGTATPSRCSQAWRRGAWLSLATGHVACCHLPPHPIARPLLHPHPVINPPVPSPHRPPTRAVGRLSNSRTRAHTGGGGISITDELGGGCSSIVVHETATFLKLDVGTPH